MTPNVLTGARGPTQAALAPFEGDHAHPASAVEWWFVQGYVEAEGRPRRHFMTTLFRSNLAAREGGQRHGCQLLVTTLDEGADGPHRSLTWVDDRVVQKAIDVLAEPDGSIDVALQRALRHELIQHGPPRPVVLKRSPDTFASDPLLVRWEEFSLEQLSDRIRLKVPDPDGADILILDLHAGAGIDVALGAERARLGAGMAYNTYPRLQVSGRSAQDALWGEAWLDHQWGDIDWFHDRQSDVWLGWDWFGFNLDDGSDLLVMRHRNARTGEIVSAHATWRGASGAIEVSHDFAVTPVTHWESPATHIRYPASCCIDLPDFGARLIFEPLQPDQEVTSFGIGRAVWEGAGSVHGLWRGRPIRGRARGEFYGYGHIFDHDAFLRQMGVHVDRHLEAFLPRTLDAGDVRRLVGPPLFAHDLDVYNEALVTPVWDLMDRGGRRWRPIFGILMLEALDTPSDQYQGLICAISELPHSGALVVDDVEDESELRRGQPCLHRRYGVGVALNAGHMLYCLPSSALLDHPLLTETQRGRMLEIKERLSIQAHAGQLADIAWSRALSVERLRRWLSSDIEDRILQMYAYKTGAAPKTIAAMAGVIANASPEVTAACVDFAQLLGISYQIVDDIHDFSRSPGWTKVCGEDLTAGKLTYVIATAIRQLRDQDSARLQTILCSPELRRDPRVLQEGFDLVLRSGALETCREKARALTNEGWQRFTAVVPPSDPKILLHAVCIRLLEVTY